ncbi:DNA cytosine methyltransferase [Staphylococcus pseudintermedius]|nr:DNA cytosine methyltransferase [Staphylococcus pseudintermedius]USO12445.1 DNA cytosine methyltransferase [Staphylococcus pseudintermedius]USO12923.1 DNA cytosine methyltransferase [Staphylococcus pseudintermedius]
MNENYSVIDLFCGAGGLSRGFFDEGFEIVLGIDNNEMALNTFAKNHGETIAINLDLYKKENIKKISEEFSQHSKNLMC